MMALGLIMAASIIVAVFIVVSYAIGLFSVQFYVVAGAIIFGVLVNIFGVSMSIHLEDKIKEKQQSEV